MSLDVIKSQARKMKEFVSAILVKDETALKSTSDWIKKIKDLQKTIEAEKDRFVLPAKQIIQEAREKYDPYIDICKSAEAELKEKARLFLVEYNAKIRVQENKIQQKVESGKLDIEKGVEKLEALPEIAKGASTESSNLSLRTYQDVEIFDEAALPREYLIPDRVKIRKVVLAGIEVPGARKVEKTTMASKSNGN